jgi:hypothetical protein
MKCASGQEMSQLGKEDCWPERGRAVQIFDYVAIGVLMACALSAGVMLYMHRKL